MIAKAVHGVTLFFGSILFWICSCLGLYSAYDILFNMDIPLGFSAPLIIIIFLFSYYSTAKDKKIDAVPIMVTKNGQPIDVNSLGGFNGNS